MDKIDEVIDKLANFVALWLLIYQYEEEKLILLLITTGSHSELFK